MLRVGQSIFVALGLLAVASACQADMTNLGWSDATPATPFVSAPAADSAPLTLDGGSTILLGTGLPQESFPTSGEPAAAKTLELPSGPDSTGLFLSALGSLGAWQLGRSVKKINLGHLPEWYHAEAPAQVGHVRVAELDFDGLIRWDGGDSCPLPLDLQAVSRSSRGELLQRWSQNYLAPAAPRGPPRLAA